MNNSPTTYSRRGGILLIAGAALTIAGAVFSAALQGIELRARQPGPLPVLPRRVPSLHRVRRRLSSLDAHRGPVPRTRWAGRLTPRPAGSAWAASSPVWRCCSCASGRSCPSPTSPPRTLGRRSSTAGSASPLCSSPGHHRRRRGKPAPADLGLVAPVRTARLRAAVLDRDPDPVHLGPVARDHRALRWLLSSGRRNDQRRRPPYQDHAIQIA